MRIALVAGLAGLLVHSVLAQGRTDYFNVETPQVKPLAVATLAGHDYLLACNTPDNSVEVWDTAEPPTFLKRIPVGLEPCSVVWSAERSAFYTTDFLSDSVTVVLLAAPTGPASLTFAVDRTVNVGDEPVHLALSTDATKIYVSFMSEHRLGTFNAATIAPGAFVGPTPKFDLEVDGWALKEPRTVAVLPAAVGGGVNRLLVLGHKGGNSAAYDFDLWSKNLTAGPSQRLGGLGSTNTNMAIASNGDVWVVGGFARNDLVGGPAVAAAAVTDTGFVESRVYRVRNAGQSTVSVVSRDINEEFDPATGTLKPITSPLSALTLPTDVALFDTVVNGIPTTKVFIAAMGSDRIGVLYSNNLQGPGRWTLHRIDVPPQPSAPATGPRGLVLKPANGALPARLYVMNRLDQSIAVIDPLAETIVGSFALNQDPTPPYVHAGRWLLYTAKRSQKGFATCASCHSDGRTDALGWDLGSASGFAAPFPDYFPDGPSNVVPADLPDFLNPPVLPDTTIAFFNPFKELLMTQSLQGLLNFELPRDVQDFTTNAPYHWRGDRALFTAFNEAFANLFSQGDVIPGGDPQGIQIPEMEAFEEFINSIHYPPNPNQQQDRTYSGDFGTPDDDGATGTGARRGLKLFHTRRLTNVQNRSCVQCHSLPEGSNNRFTVKQNGGPPTALRADLETAALRGLFQMEARLDRDATGVSSIVIGDRAIEHAGRLKSLNNFIEDVFSSEFPDPWQLLDLKRYVRELDWGVAPMVGQVEPVLPPATPANQTRITAFEQQVGVANLGLAVRVWNGASIPRGFRFDPVQQLYIEEGVGLSPPMLTRAAVLALVAGGTDRAMFMCTPLGSERRVAAPLGTVGALAASTPTSVELVAMHPNTANQDVPLMTKNWTPTTVPSNTFDFLWVHEHGLPTPLSLHAMRLMQYGLIQGGIYGITQLRHDPPRRFRLRGDGIQEGAILWIYTPDGSSAPDVQFPPEHLGQPVTRALRIPIYPTASSSHGSPIWESAVELDAITYYRMMVGGPNAPGVQAAFADFYDTPQHAVPEPPAANFFDPFAYNWHYVRLENPGQTPVDFGWQRITVD